MASNTKYDVLGVGSPILDHLLKVQDEYLDSDSVPGEKYGMEQVTHKQMVTILEGAKTTPQQIAGGSAANAIKGLAALGRQCALIGMIGDDPIGKKVLDDFQDYGVITTSVQTCEGPTAQVACLITPDGNRTCRTFLGASRNLKPEHLKAEHFHGTRLVHIEGYMILLEGIVDKALHLAKEAGSTVSYDLGSHEIAKKYDNQIINYLKKSVDIVFANEAEASALTKKDALESCKIMQQWCDTAVVMTGEKGGYIGHKGEVFAFKTIPVKAKDSTGAGDLFASGFLHGYLEKKPLKVCAQWGAITGRTIVQIVGAEIPKDRWEAVIKEMNSI